MKTIDFHLDHSCKIRDIYNDEEFLNNAYNNPDKIRQMITDYTLEEMHKITKLYYTNKTGKLW